MDDSATVCPVWWALTPSWGALVPWAAAAGLVPIDKWPGPWHDGSAAAQARIEARRRRTEEDR